MVVWEFLNKIILKHNKRNKNKFFRHFLYMFREKKKIGYLADNMFKMKKKILLTNVSVLHAPTSKQNKAF